MNATTCDTDNDCTNADYSYLWCNGNGICGCFHGQGAQEEDGMCRIGSTWKATTHFALTCIVFISSMLVLAYHTYATWLVVRLGAKGTIRKLAFCVELQAVGWTGRQQTWFKWCGTSTRHSLPYLALVRPTGLCFVSFGVRTPPSNKPHAAAALTECGTACVQPSLSLALQ